MIRRYSLPIGTNAARNRSRVDVIGNACYSSDLLQNFLPERFISIRHVDAQIIAPFCQCSLRRLSRFCRREGGHDVSD